ncbi:ricin-type beta-trefoil lectin domain protein [Streptomyces sp. NPDC058691]|uniref:ricin-type beta-trefoil lectin domain protein n=1 Tax=Streptomyces sp. NPDC058691 TaxID=3346601 RepID=UPI00365554F5
MATVITKARTRRPTRTRISPRWTGRIAAAVGFALLPGLIAAPGFAAAPILRERPKLPAPHVDKVVPFAHRETTADRQVAAAEKADRADAARARADQARTVTWPKAGSVRLTPGTGARAAATASGMPVTAAAPHAGSRGARAATASSVTVDVRDQKTAEKAGVKGIILTAAGPAGGGAAELTVDYSSFASAYGGDWAGRLRLVQLPACALTTPDKAACRTQRPMDSANDRNAETVTAQLSLPTAKAATASAGAPMVLALAAGTKSSIGDYKATPLAASSTWNAGGNSGSFTWSYPLRVPPAAAGPSPNLSISYDSGSIDGRTGNTNNQGSWVGEGFDVTSSYIERKYVSCDDDDNDDDAAEDGKFDLCWKYDNASLVLNGKATELVKNDTGGKWHLKDDDASQVIHDTGADNGDDDGETWTVITGDGTQYKFGLNKLPGAGAADSTNSTWTVPVFGNDPGEPGYSSGTSFSGRAKKQAWRWNLDYVVDTHDNAMTYWYAADTNYYAKNGVDKPSTDYIRGGYLKEIHYGQRAGALFSATPAYSDKVVFSVDERCDSGCDTLDEDHRDNWPDVPFDTICAKDDACTGNLGPTFFIRKKLTGITTSFWDTTLATPAYSQADTWSLKQEYLDPGDTNDSSDQSLWLDEIKHTGKHGTDLALPPVTFTHTWLTNRVDSSFDGKLPLYKPRLKSVTSETGAQTIVSYADQDCVAGQTMPKPDTNTRRCYPVYWAANGASEATLDWFNKYPVIAVSTSDASGGGQAVSNTYSYSGGGAWHYNDDPMTPDKERTWSIWRGYEKVTHLTGDPTGTQSKDVTVYLRGMDGDRVLDAEGKKVDPDKRKSVSVTGIKATAITDSDQYASFTRESVTYNGTDEVSGTINDPWSQNTATQHKSYADTEAYFVRTGASHARTNITSGVTPYDRVRTTSTTYDDHGMPIKVEDKGDDAKTGDEKCTRTWYARNTSGITSLVSRTRVVGRNCGIDEVDLNLPADSTTAGDVISDTAIAYDTTTWSEDQTPTKGEPQWTGRAKGYTTADAPTWQKVATTTYDDLGRPKVVKDTNDQTVSTTSYLPPASGPLTSTTVADAKTYATTTTLDPAWGAPLKTSDANNKATDYEYDSLGRVTKVWLPNYARGLDKPPTYVYTYHVTASEADNLWVATGALKGDGSGYNTTYQIYDSLMRPRQVQTASPRGGRVIANTLYDSRGLAVATSSDIYDNKKGPEGDLADTPGGGPVSTDTTYDGAARPTQVVTKNFNVTRWTSTTTYTGDTVTTTPPVGATLTPGDGQAVATVTNALGQTTERREYDAPKAAGAHYTTTSFTYFPAGQSKTVTGPDATWSYTYDLFGRQVSATDPDKGKTTTDYNELDQVISTKDAASRVLLYEYDQLGRKRKMWGSSKTDASLLAAWDYDTLAKGQQDSATRYDGGLTGKAYTKKVTTYDALYRPTATQVILPATDPLVTAGVPSTLAFGTTYNLDGTISSTKEPAVAGLASEIVSNTYSDLGLQLTSQGTSQYLQTAGYSPLGDLEQLNLAKTPTDNTLTIANSYEPGTRRLISSVVTDNTHPYDLQSLHYKQDDAGNVTAIFDTANLGGISKADYQCFTYDGDRRMTEAWTPATADCATTGRTTANLGGAAPYWSSYQYNDAGLRTNETSHATAGNTSVDNAYSPTKLHQLTSTTTTRPDSTSFTSTYAYDATGNTWIRPGGAAGHTLDWNTESQLSRTTTDAGQITGLSKKCLTIQGGVTTDGTPVEITTCNTSDAQKWRLKTDGTLQALGVCATATGTTSGSAVQIKACAAGNAAQQWKQRDDGSLYNPNSGMCVDIPTSDTTDGKDLQIYTCNTTGAQTWTVTKQTKYLYDADGQLLIRRAAADGETVLYLGATEVHLKTAGTTATLTGTRYYTAAGQTIAVRTVSGTTNTVTFLAGDNHGTSSLAFQAGASTFTKRYTTPFGASRGTKPTTWPDDKAFLGAPADATTSLTHIGAREYDPTIGRFLSVDPILNTAAAQSLNGYTYASNNPATSADPTGLCPRDECGGYGQNPHPADAQLPAGTFTGDPADANTCQRGDCGGGDPDNVLREESDKWWDAHPGFDGQVNYGNYGCGAVSAGSNCSGTLTPGQLAAQGTIETLDPTGVIGLLECSQSLERTQCGLAVAASLPIAGKGVKLGEKVGEKLLAKESGEAASVLYHGTDAASAKNIWENGLDVESATSKHMDGVGGFFLATERDDAVYYALRRQPGALIKATISPEAMAALRSAGAELRNIPYGGPGTVAHVGQEFHVPKAAFGIYNELRNSGGILYGPG